MYVATFKALYYDYLSNILYNIAIDDEGRILHAYIQD
jgi:hypothetical protein